MSSSARIDELRRKFDENPRRYFAPLANEYRKAGDFDQAIFICQEYLPQQPGHMSGHIVFGQALFEAKRLPEARTVFETALTLDPENLIALRHLADISRDLGELGPARVWYERVLQADPRNEEVAAIMASMAAQPTKPAGSSPIAPTEETPAVVTSAAEQAPPASISTAAAPTMELSAAAVQEMVKARQAAQAAQAATAEPQPELISLDDSATIEVNAVAAPPVLEGFESTRSEETFDVPSGAMLGLEPTSAASPPADLPVDNPGASGSDSLTLDDFTLPTAPPAQSVAAPSVQADTDGLMDLGSFGFTEPAVPPIQPTTADAAQGGSADGEVPGPIDMDFDIPTTSPAAQSVPALDGVDTTVIEAIPEIDVPVLEPLEEPMPLMVEDLEVKTEPDVTSPTVVMEAVPKNVATVREETEPTVVADLNSPAVPTPAATAPFVTETMAQLYLEQGHRAEALEIYRQLIAARPDDAALQARFEAVEQAAQKRSGSQSAEAAGPSAPAIAHPADIIATPATSRFSSGRPTIRDVLRELLGVDAASSTGNGSSHTEPGAEVGSIDVLFATEALVGGPSPLAAAFDGGYVAAHGTVDAVFGGGA